MARVREEKWQTCWRCQDQQRACRIAQALAEKIELIRPAKRERVASVPQREQLASTPSRLCLKEKQQNRLYRAPDCEVGKSQGEREPHLCERKRGIIAGA